MKIDYIIGNPPYQEQLDGTSDKPIYNFFMDAANNIGERVEMITPARFLFDAGKTPKAWNQSRLNDKHFKVLFYANDSSKVFPNTSINGGVAITYRDKNKDFGAIKTFVAYDELKQIVHKVQSVTVEYLSECVFAPETYKFTDTFHAEHPECEALLSKGHKYDITSNIFEKLPGVFMENPLENEETIAIFGRFENQREYRYVAKKYIIGGDNLNYFKVFLSKADGAAGQIGAPVPARIIGKPTLAEPNEAHTQTFISIGKFDTKEEAIALEKYLKTKFARCMVGVMKVTQDNKKGVWQYVPNQDFKDSSDIDWTQSISRVDEQLYRKYRLSQKEIDFIETYVKEME